MAGPSGVSVWLRPYRSVGITVCGRYLTVPGLLDVDGCNHVSTDSVARLSLLVRQQHRERTSSTGTWQCDGLIGNWREGGARSDETHTSLPSSLLHRNIPHAAGSMAAALTRHQQLFVEFILVLSLITVHRAPRITLWYKRLAHTFHTGSLQSTYSF